MPCTSTPGDIFTLSVRGMTTLSAASMSEMHSRRRIPIVLTALEVIIVVDLLLGAQTKYMETDQVNHYQTIDLLDQITADRMNE